RSASSAAWRPSTARPWRSGSWTARGHSLRPSTRSSRTWPAGACSWRSPSRISGRRVPSRRRLPRLPITRATLTRTAVSGAAAPAHRVAPRPPAVRVSAVTGDGLDALRSALASLLGVGRAGGLAGAVANPRHADALARARAALARAGEAAQAGAPGEIVALELREGLAALGEVSGRSATEELLERIFARFCIGK